MKSLRVVVASLLFIALPLSAADPVALTPTISANTLTARIDLPGGVAADLSIVFEQAVGLNASALSLTASLADPRDPSLLARFPDATLISLPAAFPVVVRVEPTQASTLSFSGVAAFSLHTDNLKLITNSPLRVFKAPAGGTFQDMTGYLAVGSVRGGGTTPGFSDFLIVADLRPIDAVIGGKFTALQTFLTSNASSITPAVLSDLQARLDQAKDLYSAGSIQAATNSISSFADLVKRDSGSDIPDVWRAGGSAVNVAGLLRAGADTLKFSLIAKANGSP